jgi:hypothetical protein
MYWLTSATSAVFVAALLIALPLRSFNRHSGESRNPDSIDSLDVGYYWHDAFWSIGGLRRCAANPPYIRNIHKQKAPARLPEQGLRLTLAG